MNLSEQIRALFPSVRKQAGPLPGIDYTLSWTANTSAKGQPSNSAPTIATWTPKWPLAPGAAYPAQPTAAQLAAGPTLTPQQIFDAAVAAGFTYTIPGSNPAQTLTLDLSDGARAQFTGLVVLLNAAMAANPAAANSNQSIADKGGMLHSLPASEIITMLLSYGTYYAGLFNKLHAATTAAAAPTPTA